MEQSKYNEMANKIQDSIVNALKDFSFDEIAVFASEADLPILEVNSLIFESKIKITPPVLKEYIKPSMTATMITTTAFIELLKEK
jgi:hypothetical protein